ncbi:MAG: TIGR02710 family CRISPR-associated CARF protein [Dehalococcoidia bacterium]|nr:TIGR02710 family CRISPR-associated CARF protein [Dehalococcoidia bacterium]
MINTLLVCTVGGEAAPVAAAIKGCSPARILFLLSPQTERKVQDEILPLLAKEGVRFSPGQYEMITVPDAQDFAGCVERIRGIEADVVKWSSRGPDYRVVVDFTGGTKCMSAALALVARPWACTYSYVGGTERSKAGVGVVIDGKEKTYHTENPWDALGYQTAEEGIALFNKRDYRATIDVVERDFSRVKSAKVKTELNSLKMLAEGYLLWDLFNHGDAKQKLKDVERNINNLCRLTGDRHQDLKVTIVKHLGFLAQFSGQWGHHTVVDLCANARRCAQRGRYDDGVARLYRAIEATAQLRLRDHYDLADTGKVPIARVPEPLRSKWASRARDGLLLLSLQDDYQLLESFGDELSERFHRLSLSGKESPLGRRNMSILAHGFEPVKKQVFDELYHKTIDLTGISEDDLPEFPTLSRAIE